MDVLLNLQARLHPGKRRYGRLMKLALNLALRIASTDGKVLYVDSNNSFSAQRIVELCNGFNNRDGVKTSEPLLNSADGVLRNIQVLKCFVLPDLISYLDELLNRDERCFDIIIIDSIGALLSPLLGHGMNQGYALMDELVDNLRNLGRRWRLPVVVPKFNIDDQLFSL
jgi:RecA/RadA recombinase